MPNYQPMESDAEYWWKQVAGGLHAPPAPRPWRAVEGPGMPGLWEVLDANGIVLLATRHRALAELIARIPDVMEGP